MRLFFSLLLCACVYGDSDERRKKYPELFELVEKAHAAPPEFAASTLLRVADSSSITEPAWKIELIEEAFRLAARVQHPVRKKLVKGVALEGRTSSLSWAYQQNLDRLTLESMAVERMLRLDKKKALNLFSEIRIPKLIQAECSDFLINDTTPYFSAFESVSHTAISLKKDKLETIKFILSNVQSPIELPSLLTAWDRSFSPQDYAEAIGWIAGAMDRLSGDDRAFSDALRDVSAKFEEQHDIPGLVETYRAFLVRHFTAPRCQSGKLLEDTKYAADVFNSRFIGPLHANVSALTETEMKPAKVVELLKREPAFSGFENLRQLVMDLMFTVPEGHSSATWRTTNTWRDKFQAFLRDSLDAKQDTNEVSGEFFSRKAGMLASAVTMAPNGQLRQKTVIDYLAFLAHSDMQRENFLLWIAELGSLVDITRNTRAEEYQNVLVALEASGHPVMSLYAMRERLLASPPKWANPPALVQ